MSIEIVKGDLFKMRFDARAHGCNTKGAMGAGIALQFKKALPDMYDQYRWHCLENAPQVGGVFSWVHNNGFSTEVIYNLFTQDEPGPNARIEWVHQAVGEMLYRANKAGVRTIGMPQIGCGIGGLKWEDVERVLNHWSSFYPDIKITVVEYAP